MAPSQTSSAEIEYLKTIFGAKAPMPPNSDLVGERGFHIGIKGLSAIVTGGTKGIGRAIVDMFAESGTNVSICARNAAEVEQAVKEIRAANPSVKVHGQALDMSSPAESIKAYVEAAAAAMGGLDCVISNAAALAIGPSRKAFEANFQVDLLGCLALADASMPHFKKSKAPSFVAISSVSARQSDDLNSYGALKAALIHAVKGLAGKHAAQGIRFNVVSPGTTIFPNGAWETNMKQYPAIFNGAKERNPTLRMASAREVARAAIYLASPAASFVSGTNLIVDGQLTKGVSL